MGSTGQVSPDPDPKGPETRGSPGRVSPGSTVSRSKSLSPGQVHGPDTTMGTQSAESLADLCTVSTVQAGPSHAMMEALEQDFTERKSRCASSIFDSSPELISQVDPQDDLLLNQLEPPEVLQTNKSENTLGKGLYKSYKYSHIMDSGGSHQCGFHRDGSLGLATWVIIDAYMMEPLRKTPRLVGTGDRTWAFVFLGRLLNH
ncbi:uncharacterized protein LOC117285841 [Fukomys damarensis]|uniref:uncharacterized protein LOC117285841 n=1 Tax=Fukomys damarensis TaxID=885580 RepID=UPI0014554532|nr:uncharacterized protein LOC117285841 [Fukomys damarensis]